MSLVHMAMHFLVYQLLALTVGDAKSYINTTYKTRTLKVEKIKLEMWSNEQRDAALPNRCGALCSTPQSLTDAQYWSAVR